MSEAKLTDIHFLAVSVFYKHTHYIPPSPPPQPIVKSAMENVYR